MLDQRQVLVKDPFDHETGERPWSSLPASILGIQFQWSSARRDAHLGDLIAENAESLAQTEVRDNGKLMSEMLAQCKYLPEWYYFYGGLADKVEGRAKCWSVSIWRQRWIPFRCAVLYLPYG